MMFNKKALLHLATIFFLGSVVSGQKNSNLRYMVRYNGKDIAVQTGGKVALEVVKADIAAIEFPNEDVVRKFKKKAVELGIEFEIDPIREIPTDRRHGKNPNRVEMAEDIPWGIEKTYELDGVVDIPPQSYYPDASEVVHPVCVIDSGYWRSHEDLPNDAEVAPGQSESYAFEDGCEHGTHCAGTIGAIGYNGEGVIGVYPGAPKFKIVKVFANSCSWSYASGLIGAANACQEAGASILSMSLGGSFFSSFENTEFQRLRDEGVFSIAAAGNGASTSYSYPASYDSVMSVAATDVDNNAAWFSQRNDQVNIAAPGVNVLSTITPPNYDFFSGTSMATPHVAGAAMVLWNKRPEATIDEIQNALQDGAIDLGTPGRDDTFGHGLMNYWNSIDLLEPPPPTVSPAPSGTQAPTMESYPASLEVTTDNWGFETGWTLKTVDGTIDSVDTGAYESYTTYNYDWDLFPACYEFTITDSFGDGICCGWGDGNYDLVFNGETIVSGGGDFDSSETTTFGDEGKEFMARYQGKWYTLGCDWISSQDQFPISTVCTYNRGNAGTQCPCVCSGYD